MGFTFWTIEHRTNQFSHKINCSEKYTFVTFHRLEMKITKVYLFFLVLGNWVYSGNKKVKFASLPFDRNSEFYPRTSKQMFY